MNKILPLPTYEQVCIVLEDISMQQLDDYKKPDSKGVRYLAVTKRNIDNYGKLSHYTYAFTHIVRNPSCIHVHKNWINDFWEYWNKMEDHDGISNEPQCYVEVDDK